MKRQGASPISKMRLRSSTKLLLLEIVCFLAVMLLWHINCIYYDAENMVIFLLYFFLLIACVFIGAGMIIAVLEERKKLCAFGVPRLIMFLIAALILPHIHLKQTDAWRDSKSELQSREHAVRKPGEALIEYAKAHGGNIPSSENWCDELKSFDPKLTDSSFDAQCRFEPYCTVAFNKNISSANLQELASETVMLFEANGPWNLSGGVEQMISQAGKKEFVFVFLADGKIYKYYFSRNQAKDVSNETYLSIQWKP